MASSSSSCKRFERDGTNRLPSVEEDKEVKEVEWVLLYGGAMVGSMTKHAWRDYIGHDIVQHKLKLPVKDLTTKVLFDEVRRILGLSDDDHFYLSYIVYDNRPPRRVDHNPRQVLDLISWSNMPFEVFWNTHLPLGFVRKPVKLYHTPTVRQGNV